MGREQAIKAERRAWRSLSLDERADMAEKFGVDTLLYCRHPWALRHSFVDKETGVVIRARCNRWDCLHCGPRKVDVWRQLVRQAEPVLFLTLTKAGKTVQEAARALTTFVQALRRGSKGRGKGHIGVRLAYLIEYFAVLERHRDFERNGFHWHILIKGVDHIPYKEVIVPLWTSAIRGKRTEEEMLRLEYGYTEEEIQALCEEEGQEGKEFKRYGWIERIRSPKAIGYVTKYLMKTLSSSEVGTRQVERERVVTVEDDDGDILGFERRVEAVEVASKAHRIRYSRNFFPERLAKMRERLFGEVEQTAMERGTSQTGDDGKPLEQGEEEQQKSSWTLVERFRGERVDIGRYKARRFLELTEGLEEMRERDLDEYIRLKRLALAEVAEEVRELLRKEYEKQRRTVLREILEEDRHISRRVISMWDYQRREVRQGVSIE
jgi:hypothetical protein